MNNAEETPQQERELRGEDATGEEATSEETGSEATVSGETEKLEAATVVFLRGGEYGRKGRATFNATEAIEEGEISTEDLREMVAEEDLGPGFATDKLARAAIPLDEEVKDLFRFLSLATKFGHDTGGFGVRVRGREDLIAWMARHRPEVLDTFCLREMDPDLRKVAEKHMGENTSQGEPS